jgi:hypothetical protein
MKLKPKVEIVTKAGVALGVGCVIFAFGSLTSYSRGYDLGYSKGYTTAKVETAQVHLSIEVDATKLKQEYIIPFTSFCAGKPKLIKKALSH